MERIVAWIHEKNPGLDGPIGDDEDLIEARLIDSLDFLEFVYLLESVSGREIDLQEVTIDDFGTLNRIKERFLSTAPAPAAPQTASR
ncbi:acyl carrier protein [Streptomyces sp. C11-1]|uniref:Acyl carrier protein n=1 Tax=Streptomyces durocortorensis TaxID=2811104 RepID=A0ABY9W4F6_9ACTN|nr:acyl carrier protein [Streptomyces durocortorensis]WNF30705.1 acyl carrier protein [Streptomyces durocortorensis]